MTHFFHRTANNADLDNIEPDPQFAAQVQRVCSTYPDNGNRGNINSLVGMFFNRYL